MLATYTVKPHGKGIKPGKLRAQIVAHVIMKVTCKQWRNHAPGALATPVAKLYGAPNCHQYSGQFCKLKCVSSKSAHLVL